MSTGIAGAHEESEILRKAIQSAAKTPLKIDAFRNAALHDDVALAKLAGAFGKRVVGLEASVPRKAEPAREGTARKAETTRGPVENRSYEAEDRAERGGRTGNGLSGGLGLRAQANRLPNQSKSNEGVLLGVLLIIAPFIDNLIACFYLAYLD